MHGFRQLAQHKCTCVWVCVLPQSTELQTSGGIRKTSRNVILQNLLTKDYWLNLNFVLILVWLPSTAIFAELSPPISVEIWPLIVLCTSQMCARLRVSASCLSNNGSRIIHLVRFVVFNIVSLCHKNQCKLVLLTLIMNSWLFNKITGLVVKSELMRLWWDRASMHLLKFPDAY